MGHLLYKMFSNRLSINSTVPFSGSAKKEMTQIKRRVTI